MHTREAGRGLRGFDLAAPYGSSYRRGGSCRLREGASRVQAGMGTGGGAGLHLPRLTASSDPSAKCCATSGCGQTSRRISQDARLQYAHRLEK